MGITIFQNPCFRVLKGSSKLLILTIIFSSCMVVGYDDGYNLSTNIIDIVYVNETSIPIDITLSNYTAILYVFDYELEEGTVISWELQSSNVDRNFSFVIADNLDNLYSSNIMELHNINSITGYRTITHSGIWYLLIEHPTYFGDYDVTVTGLIEQIGTIPPSATSDTSVPTTSTATTDYTGDNLVTILGVSIVVILIVIVVCVYWKKDGIFSESSYTESIESSDSTLEKGLIERAFSTINKQFSRNQSVSISKLRDDLSVNDDYDEVDRIISYLLKNNLLRENSDNTYGLADDYKSKRSSILESLE
ncbi:MAG: hypothetical protein ACTSU3_10600 [Candidatus Thorarchaeota archaeon]